MTSSRLTRRALLGAAGAGALLAPLVPLLNADAQEQTAAPRRLLFLYSSNGMVHEKWVPSMQGGELVLSEILQPLERHKQELLVVDGLNYQVVMDLGQKDGHYGGMNTALTGARAKIIDVNDPDGNSLADGISVDQVIAEQIGADTKFKSLQNGIQVDQYAATVASLSYAGPQQPLPVENDPYKVFDRVFGDFQAPDSEPDPAIEQLRLDRRSVIDRVRAELQLLAPKIGASDRIKLEAHLDGLRALEQRLDVGVGASALDSCGVPGASNRMNVNDNDNIPALGRLQMDLLVMAMACDLTRVGTVQYGRAGAQHRFTWLGDEFRTDPDNGPNDSTSGIHGLAHNEANPDSRAKLARCHQWYAGEMAYLLDRLKEVPEGGGSMADNTLVVWMNEMGTGNHRLDKTPWVLAGTLAGTLNTGRLIQAPEQPHNRLLLSMIQAFGIEAESIGERDYGDEPLAGLI